MKAKLTYWTFVNSIKGIADLFSQCRDYCIRAVSNGDAVADSEGFILSKKNATIKHAQSATVKANVEDAKLVEAVKVVNLILRAQSGIGFKFASLAQGKTVKAADNATSKARRARKVKAQTPVMAK